MVKSEDGKIIICTKCKGAGKMIDIVDECFAIGCHYTKCIKCNGFGRQVIRLKPFKSHSKI